MNGKKARNVNQKRIAILKFEYTRIMVVVGDE